MRAWDSDKQVVLPDRAADTKVAVDAVGKRLVGSIARSRGDRKLRYLGLCECGGRFIATSARQIYCQNCGTGKARVARLRASRSARAD